jgi:hypothetical protein
MDQWRNTNKFAACRYVGQVANLRRIVNPPLVGQTILAAAGFQPAHFVSRDALVRDRLSLV